MNEFIREAMMGNIHALDYCSCNDAGHLLQPTFGSAAVDPGLLANVFSPYRRGRKVFPSSSILSGRAYVPSWAQAPRTRTLDIRHGANALAGRRAWGLQGHLAAIFQGDGV